MNASSNIMTLDVASFTSTAPIYAGPFLQHVLPTWTNLTSLRRRDLASAISCAARILGLPKDGLILDCASLNELLTPGSVAAQTVSANTKSSLRFILRRLDLHVAKNSGPLTAPWEALLATLPTLKQRYGLTAFARHCGRIGVNPGAVSSDTLATFEKTLKDATLCANPSGKARSTLALWNKFAGRMDGWPSTQLLRRSKRTPYTLPLTAYPATFQMDVEKFLARLACTDLEHVYVEAGEDMFMGSPRSNISACASRGRRKPARPRTVQTRSFQIRLAAAALVHRGHALDEINGLRALVHPAGNASDIASFFWDRAGRKKNGQVAGIIELQRQIALHHCGLPASEVQVIADRAKRAAPPRHQGMTQKNRHRLRTLADETNRAVLLHLPAQLMKEAEAAGAGSHDAGQLAMSAVALEILLICPMRLANLQMLRLDKSLLRLGAGMRHLTHLVVHASEVKNELNIEWPLPSPTAALIDSCIKRFRPALALPNNKYLFPGLKGDEPRSLSGMRATLCDPVLRWVRVKINPHLLRHFAAWSFLKENPGAYETVRRVLGHKDIQTTIAFYTGLEAEFAATHFDATVLKERHATKTMAAAVFRQGSRSRGGRPAGHPG